MHPVLAAFDLGATTVTVTAYATFLCAAAVTAGLLGARALTGLGAGRLAAACGLVAAVVAGLVGARLLSVVLDWPVYAADPGRIVELHLHGFALSGGLLAGSLAMLAIARRLGVAPARLADRAVGAVVAGIVLVRIGCFLNGCCAGIATDLPWGVVASGSGASGLFEPAGWGFLGFVEQPAPVHPTQLYEIGAALLCGALAWRLARRGAPPGVPASAFAAAFLTFRAADQVLRLPPPDGGIPGPALVVAYAVVAAVVGAAALWWWWRSPAGRGPNRAAGRHSDRLDRRPLSASS